MNEESIFAAAIKLQDDNARLAYLDEACKDHPELRSQVEELLKASGEAGSFLNHPPAGMMPTMHADAGGDDTVKGQAGINVLPFLAPCDTPGRIGKLVGKASEYEIIEVVGQGGMGAVLRALDTKLNRIVAVKVLAPELAANPTAVKRFLREAQTAAAVHHDHVVTIHAIDDEHRPPFIVMQFVEGQTLQQKIDKQGTLELKQILRIGSQMAAGLAAAHKHGLIHRDVKPGNILLENGVERVKISDFGLARTTDDLEMTKTGQIAGTPQYMSPEQAKGEPIDTRSDLFSLGSVLYAMCTGRPAFRAESALAVMRRVCDDTPRPIREVNPEIPQWLEQIVNKLLSKDPTQRYQTAGEVADVLSQRLAEAQNPHLKSQISDSISQISDAKPRRNLITAAACIALILIALAISEASGVTKLAATIIRITTGEGTIVVQVDDPSIKVTVDGQDIVITEAGAQEIRVRPGKHQIEAAKEGAAVVIDQPLVTVQRGGRQIVSVAVQPPAPKQATARTGDEVRNLAGEWEDNDGEWGSVSIVADRFGYRGAYTATFNREPGIIGFKHTGEGAYAGNWTEPDRKYYGRFTLRAAADGQSISLRWDAEDGRNRSGTSIWTRKASSPAAEPKPVNISTWGTFVDPRGECGQMRTGRRLSIVVPGTRPYNLLPTEGFNLDAPRIVQELEGDFLIQATVMPYARPKPNTSSRPNRPVSFRAAGLLVWVTERTFLRFERASFGEQGNGAPYLNREWYVDGQIGTPDDLPVPVLPDSPTHLQIERRGQVLHLRRSEDGRTWTEANAVHNLDLPPRVSVGLVASNSTNTPFTADFQELRLRDQVAAVSQAAPQEGWVQLFNGKDRSGWKLHPQQPGDWKVVDGVLTGTAGPRSHLYSERSDFHDFELRCEVRLNADANSGILLRTPFAMREPETPLISTPNGYEVNLVEGKGLDGTRQYLSGGIIPLGNTLKVNLIQENQWHTVKIKAQGDQFETWIDDVKTMAGFDPQRRYQGGHIALQVYTPGTKVEFRKIEIKELPVTSQPTAKLDLQAIQANPSLADVQLFNGKDLAGWKAIGGTPGQWKVENGELTCSGPTSYLITERGDYRDIYLRLEALINAEGDSGILFRCGDTLVDVPLGNPQPPGYESQVSMRTPIETGRLFMVSAAPSPPRNRHEVRELVETSKITQDYFDQRFKGSGPMQADQWMRLQVAIIGDSIFVWVNGKARPPVKDAAFARGHIGLQHSGPQTAVRFRNIVLRELPPKEDAAPPLAVAPFDARAAKDHQEAWAGHLGTPVEITNSIGMKFRLIPPGEYVKGTSADEVGKVVDKLTLEWARASVRLEAPPRTVRISKAFYLGTTEVTIGQFKRFVDATAYQTVEERNGLGGFALVEGILRKPEHTWRHSDVAQSDLHPVGQVTGVDADAFCAWLSQQDGLTYEVADAEAWEYACRAGTQTRWSSGDDEALLHDYAWVGGPRDFKSQPVGGKLPNAFGLYDMHGNVEETCRTVGGYIGRSGHGGLHPLLTRSASRSHWSGTEEASYRQRGFRVSIVGDLGRKASPQSATINFNGTWDSPWGEVKLTHATLVGNEPFEVRGTYYEGKGIIKGTVDPKNRTLIGTFQEVPARGKVRLVISADNKSITGHFGFQGPMQDDPIDSYSWDMTLKDRL